MSGNTKPLTIWQIDPAQLTPYYDAATCEALAQAGCQVRYITSRFLYDDTMPRPEHYQTNQIYFRGLDNPRLLKYPRLRRVLRGISYPLGHWHVLQDARRLKPDVVHIQWSRLPRFDVWLIRQLKALGISVVHTVHDVVPLFALESSTDPLRKIYEEADRLILHTQANVDDFLKVYPGFSKDRMRIVPLIEFDKTDHRGKADKMQARQQLGLPLEVPIVLFFGSIRYYKGVDVLLDAFKRAVATRPDLHLVIAGKADPLERAKIPALDQITRLANVHLYEGFIPHDDLWAYYTAADVVVHPYRHIYQSAALITAMSFGRAVIVTDVGGMPETVDGNGWIVPSENPAALAEVMLEAVLDIKRLDVMGQRSRQLIEDRHSGEVVANRLIAIYQELVGH